MSGERERGSFFGSVRDGAFIRFIYSTTRSWKIPARDCYCSPTGCISAAPWSTRKPRITCPCGKGVPPLGGWGCSCMLPRVSAMWGSAVIGRWKCSVCSPDSCLGISDADNVCRFLRVKAVVFSGCSKRQITEIPDSPASSRRISRICSWIPPLLHESHKAFLVQ